MKKVLAVLLAMAMVFGLMACGEATESKDGGETTAAEQKVEAGKKIYVLGPTPDHGWTAQAGAYASAKVDEINQEGKYAAQYIAASSGEEQVDQCNTIVANGDAGIVVMMALDDSAAAGQQALSDAGIPFISFDRIIEATEALAALNYSGDNWQCGAGIAYWLQEKGMKAGDTVLVLWGDNGTVCTRRQEGFDNFLLGSEDTAKGGIYKDDKTGEHQTTEKWTQEQIDAVKSGYSTVVDPNWSADGAYAYVEQKMPEIIEKAKANGGKLFIYSMDDEMTFGVLNYLEKADAKVQADFEALEVYISAIGGMQELYDVMAKQDNAQFATAAKYFDDMMSVFFSPKMMQTVIGYGVDYLEGNWSFEKGQGSYEPVFIVGKDLAATTEGFTGH